MFCTKFRVFCGLRGQECGQRKRPRLSTPHSRDSAAFGYLWTMWTIIFKGCWGFKIVIILLMDCTATCAHTRTAPIFFASVDCPHCPHSFLATFCPAKSYPQIWFFFANTFLVTLALICVDNLHGPQSLTSVSEYLLTYQADNKKSECSLTWGVGGLRPAGHVHGGVAQNFLFF